MRLPVSKPKAKPAATCAPWFWAMLSIFRVLLIELPLIVALVSFTKSLTATAPDKVAEKLVLLVLPALVNAMAPL